MARYERAGGTVLVRLLDRVLASAAREGLDRRTLVEAAGLDDVDFTAPDARAPISRLIALWQVLAKSPLESGFGIRFGRSARARDFGLVGYAMFYSETLDDALRRLIRFSRILAESVAFRLEGAREHRVVVRPDRGIVLGTQPEIDYRLAAVLAVCREVTGTGLAPVEVTFPYHQPRSTLEHRRWFDCPLRFAHRESSIAFAARDMTLSIARRDETLAGYLSDHAEHVLRTMTTGSSVTERVRAAIWEHLSDGRPSLATIATAVGMPARTLQRRLAEEGTSAFAQLDQLRKAMATATLRDHNLPIGEVAFLLGYGEPSTFYRAFRRWTGKTPEEYRRAA
ncbi:MAG TPA: AraC family transcriptional regulator [Gemmatimonadaceae bacterium]|nr:AraC family transcriptional regulator [Gemmatimonadaceae bacterium]